MERRSELEDLARLDWKFSKYHRILALFPFSTSSIYSILLYCLCRSARCGETKPNMAAMDIGGWALFHVRWSGSS